MRTIVACLFLFTLLSCKRETQDLPEPLKEIIANSKGCTCEPYIDKYLWRNQTVYLSSCSGTGCFCITLYYDAAGKKLQMAPGYSPGQFQQEAELIKHVWKCKP